MLQIFRIEICRRLALGSKDPIFVPLGFLLALRRYYCAEDSDRKLVANPTLITKIQRSLECTPDEATKIDGGIDHTSKLIGNASIKRTLRILSENGVTVESIMENLWLFGIRKYL